MRADEVADSRNSREYHELALTNGGVVVAVRFVVGSSSTASSAFGQGAIECIGTMAVRHNQGVLWSTPHMIGQIEALDERSRSGGWNTDQNFTEENFSCVFPRDRDSSDQDLVHETSQQ